MNGIDRLVREIFRSGKPIIYAKKSKTKGTLTVAELQKAVNELKKYEKRPSIIIQFKRKFPFVTIGRYYII